MGLSEIGHHNQGTLKYKQMRSSFTLAWDVFVYLYLCFERSICKMIFSWVWSDHTSLWCGSPAGPEAPSIRAHRRASRQPMDTLSLTFYFCTVVLVCLSICTYKRGSQKGSATAQDGPWFGKRPHISPCLCTLPKSIHCIVLQFKQN